MTATAVSRRKLAFLSGAALVAGRSVTDVRELAAGEAIAPEPISFIDLHCDTIDRLFLKGYHPFSEDPDIWTGDLAQTNCDVSIDRMGGLRWAQCYAVWMPDDEVDISHIGWYETGVAGFKQMMETCSDVVEQAWSFGDIPRILDSGKVAAILTVENPACLNAGIEVLDTFADDGVLISGMTWNGTNVLASGVHEEGGLTQLGREYVAGLEERGIVLDVSHVNDTGFWEVEKLATRPFIATHSNSRAICDHKRNLTDDQFKAIRDRGGLVGLNLHKPFVYMPNVYYDFDALCAHVEHWLDLGGANVVAFGTDRDGSTDMPPWAADTSAQGHLYRYFSERLGDELARKLFFDNAMEFFRRYESDGE